MLNKEFDLSIAQSIEQHLTRFAANQQKLNALYSDVSNDIEEEIFALKQGIAVLKEYAIERDAQIQEVPSSSLIGTSHLLLNGVNKLDKLISIKDRISRLLDEINGIQAMGAGDEN
ncbi:hypothetical protein [Avibacterium paragallinarum]|uniref:hypothetical protein n=1 Tax=Avibacterium paragallinarum TaxID=728 RepID=UPI003986A702